MPPSAPSGLVGAITRAINGPACHQADLRKQLTEDCTRAFSRVPRSIGGGNPEMKSNTAD
jgi:hypothetical protein